MSDVLVWSGAAVTLAGLAVLVWCIFRAARVRRGTSSDEDQRHALQKLVAVNMGALLLSVVGLMLVIVGIFLQ